ncbi:MAG: type I DNA topoisomerase [Anaerolineae bacterium]|nr:type I DNA topoisomerase [Anaerolineae bacterium]MDW8173194.1 type I DNA topoisomerase [Anaerolineae bacterium]
MSDTPQAYCVKCKAKRDMLQPQAAFNALGRPITKGTCAVCGTSLTLIGKTVAHESLEPPVVSARHKADKIAKSDKKPSKRANKTAVSSKSQSPRGTKSAKAKTSSKKEVSKPKTSRAKRTSIGKLVIVESPAKARTVGSFLGQGYTVLASKGHVRDLLVTQLSVDVENDFEPKYRVLNEKRQTVAELKAAAQAAEEVYLATDPDREGEAIAWHLMHAADIPQEKTRRVVFHEITDQAVAEAFAHPRDIDSNLVNAQQARRILDRLVGYNVTELLWEKVRGRLSAGRVQSIALRMVVDREREIEAFVPREYWTIDVSLAKQTTNGKAAEPFIAHLSKIDGQEAELNSAEQVQPHVDALERCTYQVEEVKLGTRQRKPSPPFTTSTLQQEASRRLGFSTSRTMRIAQELYEGIEIGQRQIVGLITYMRTDSLNVSETAQAEARNYILQRFGADYAPETPPKYKTKAKGAQEAHEAIRPTSLGRAPDSLKNFLNKDQLRLYKLIWERFVASQMSPALYDTMRVDISAQADGTPRYELRTSGSRIKFAGFLALYEDTRDEDAVIDQDEGRILPQLSAGEMLDKRAVLPEQHFTQPPPRYTEASLVKALEENGIGRPSTYVPTVAVIQDRDYVTKVDKRLVPTETGKIVADLLKEYFADVMDYQFTARMEAQLDDIAEGDGVWKPMLREFYTPFHSQLEHARLSMPKVKQDELIGRDCPSCGSPLVMKYGRWGKFIGCSTYPACRYTEQYVEKLGIACPKCGASDGGELVQRKTKRGRTFYGCSRYPFCDFSTWKLPKDSSQTEQAEDEVLQSQEA